MTHPERVADYLAHIYEAIVHARAYLADVADIRALRLDTKTRDAVVLNIAIIGEASTKIQQAAPAFVAAHPEVPWRDMSRMRNRLIHNYFDVDLNTVWAVVHDDLPALQAQIAALLAHQAEPPRAQDDDPS
jgi:uncharacterized protein with HEPN domain